MLPIKVLLPSSIKDGNHCEYSITDVLRTKTKFSDTCLTYLGHCSNHYGIPKLYILRS